jgi:uncharacterized protein
VTIGQILILTVAGFAAGVMNSIAGGGTILTFPALIFAGIPPILANATSTVALLPGTAAGVAGYRKVLPAIRRWVRVYLPVSTLGGLLGGILLTWTPPQLFDVLVPFLLLFATLLFTTRNFFVRLFRIETVASQEEVTRSWLVGATAFQFLVAVYGGYFGAGIGILMLATLGFLGFHDIHEMNALKSVLGFAINGIAAAYFVVTGLVDWGAAVVVAVGAIVGGYSGAYFAQKIDQQTVRRMITVVGIGITIALFVKQARG